MVILTVLIQHRYHYYDYQSITVIINWQRLKLLDNLSSGVIACNLSISSQGARGQLAPFAPHKIRHCLNPNPNSMGAHLQIAQRDFEISQIDKSLTTVPTKIEGRLYHSFLSRCAFSLFPRSSHIGLFPF